MAQMASFIYFMRHFNYLPGTDAYYYALQIQSLLDFGRLKVADGGTFYYVVAAISRPGLSIEMSFKLVLSALYGFYNLGFLLLATHLKEKTRPLAFLLWVVSCPVVAFHVIEFPNLSMGLVTIPLWFYFFVGSNKRRVLWLCALLGACVFLHPALTALVFTFIATVALGWTGPADNRMRGFIKGLGACMVGAALAIVVVAVRWPGFGLRLRSFGVGQPGLFTLATANGVPPDLKVAILFYWSCLALMFVDCLWNGSKKWTYLTAATLAAPLLPNHDAGLSGLGGRFAASFIFLALPLIVSVWDDLGERSKISAWMPGSRTDAAVAVVLIAVIAFLPIRLRGYTGLLVADDYARYEEVVTVLARDNIPMLIAHRGLDFFYSYKLRRDAFHFDPEPNWNRTEIWRVAQGITPEEIVFYSSPTCVWGQAARTISDTDYLLVREDCWESFRARLNRDDNPDLYTEVWEDVENPSQPRPAFLRARHRNAIERPFPSFVAGR